MALAGPDGQRAATLLRNAKRQGAVILSNLARVAVARLVERGGRALSTKRLFNDSERRVLADSIAATNATAELLGRARVRERWLQTLRKHEPEKLAELPPHVELFDEPDPRILKPLPPAKAVAYFKRLVPTIGVKDPERFGAALERKAFTLAVDADKSLLERIQGLIQSYLETGRDISAGPAQIEGLLTEAGVSPRNPQYAEMVQRTNMMDSYVQGMEEERTDPDVMDVFPVWKYLGIRDGRQGADHEPHFDKYFPNTASFREVRGDRVFNCRCVPQEVSKWEWKELQGKGARVSTFAELRTFAPGTCKPGERADLTGCVPATGGTGAGPPAADKPATREHAKELYKSVHRATDGEDTRDYYRNMTADLATKEKLTALADDAETKLRKVSVPQAEKAAAFQTLADESRRIVSRMHRWQRGTGLPDSRSDLVVQMQLLRDGARLAEKKAETIRAFARKGRPMDEAESFAAGTCKTGQTAKATECVPATKDEVANAGNGTKGNDSAKTHTIQTGKWAGVEVSDYKNFRTGGEQVVILRKTP